MSALRSAIVALLVAGVLLRPTPASAQPPVEGQPLGDVLASLRGISSSLDLRTLFREAVSDPERLNSALDAALGGTRAGRILEDLNVRFASFAANESDEQGLGFTYTLSHSLKQQLFATAAARARGLDLRLNATGNVAFDRSINPRDFLSSDASLSFFFSRGGAVATDPSLRARLDTLRQALALITNQHELDTSPLLGEYMRIVMRHMTTQIHVDLTAIAGLESDQSFQQKQYVYGGRIGIDIKPWNPRSTMAQWNVFDWPFAVIRYLNGTDSTFAPRGAAFPTLLLGIAQVDPVQNDSREALGVNDPYPRASVELAMSTDFIDAPGGPLTVQLGTRWFRELGAEPAIRQARLDRFSYVTAALVSRGGPFVSYAKGRLPIDLARDEIYELGFRMHF